MRDAAITQATARTAELAIYGQTARKHIQATKRYRRVSASFRSWPLAEVAAHQTSLRPLGLASSQVVV